MQCLEESGVFTPYTRDTFNIAIKASYCEINGKPAFIFKDPKTDGESLKKSQKGCCVVLADANGGLYCKDGYTFDETFANPENKLIEVFKDGVMTKEYTLNEIRGRLHNGKF
jgi:nicotinamide phosphoribosyltransferase